MESGKIIEMNDDKKKNQLLRKIKNIDSQINLLSDLKKKLINQLNDSHQEKSISVDSYRSYDLNEKQVLSNVMEVDKISLFRNFFRGRDDVYPRFWISKKTGKSGYSPVCKNEWIPKICNKSIIKCQECPNREFIPINDEIIRKHLEGVYIIGVYPMLQDETCYFLAADFDKEDWVENVFAFKKTCIQEGVPVAIERSRSGNGAHAWVFFKENIPASLARRMGSFLITRTMSNRYKLSMKSYDRLFPNQDTLPKGGFGSLIALPFQKEAVKHGNSIFIDEGCTPYDDQWKFLSTVEKMSLKEVEIFSKEASKTGQIINIRMSPINESDPPWMRLPSGKLRYKPLLKDLPEKVELIIANRIYIKTDALPSNLLNQIKQLAAFQNPEFYKRQNMRLSTFLTPRIISCSEILDNYLSIPRGCFEDISYLLEEYGIKVDIKDERSIGKKVEFKFYGELNKDQKSASKIFLNNDIGVLVAHPGMGKTIIAIHTIAKRKTNTLILVHRKPLMEQWRLQLASFLNIDLKDIGQIGAGKNKSNGNLDIAMIQSMERKGKVDDRIIDYGFVIVDECHHISAVSFERVLMQTKAKYILGLTATPYRKDGHQPIIHMQCGPIRYQKTQKDIICEISQYHVIPRITEFYCDWSEESNIYDLWPKLINDEKRNHMIVDDVLKNVQNGRIQLVLTERRAHLKILTEMLKDKVGNLIILYGEIKPKKRNDILQELSHASDKRNVILATGTYIGEGFDYPQLDTLFITMPISFRGRVIQYAGRLHRHYPYKKDVRIYDYIDKEILVLVRMYQKRLKTYKMMGYQIREEEN
jgi:superfamily II DNA or RNA helicase